MIAPHLPKLVLETAPRPEDVQTLSESLYSYYAAKTGFTDGALFAFFLRGAEGAVTGGVYGWTWAGDCSVRYLFVPEAFRGRGMGTHLMEAVEALARSRGCDRMLTDTRDFEAPDFYKKLGFAVTHEIADYPRGHRFIMLEKWL